MKKLFKSLACVATLLLLCSITFADEHIKFKGWKQAETTHFRFIYEAASEPAAQAYAKIADEAWEKIARVYSMPQEKTNVYVFSRMNVVNAYTFFTPPEIVMFDSPILYSTFGFREDWMKIFFTHELIHIANITFEDKNYLSSKLLGEYIRGMDYSMIPGWALEGLTTVLETELTNGGRGRSPYFEIAYKAVTLDNAFIPYRLIGTEQEPPYSQIYVMGYLIMRTIADNWGLQALADVERNRTNGKTWEESIKLVTGHSAQDLYRLAKIALEKKYAGERKIHEGIIISPNDMNVNYERPAIVLDDGSIITQREDYTERFTVLLKPGAKDGRKYFEDEGEFKETKLFKGASEITADSNMNIYYTSSSARYDRSPYYEIEFPIFKWSKDENGQGVSKQLTDNNTSFYQPAVSRDGNVLVAVKQDGLKMTIVRVDTETGATTTLFADPAYSFIQPALNDDGSKIAFLILKEDRACVALGDMQTGQYKIVNNTDFDFIIDPSRPSFNKDGKLTFCSNDRGRLEVFEAVPNSDGQTFTCTPVVSDPIGALWAYKNDIAVYYASEASTGAVIKIKPIEEWGKVPDFNGPSPAGEILTLGKFQNDYPDFTPYAKLAEKEAEKPAEEAADETLDEVVKTAEAPTEQPVEETEEASEEAPAKEKEEPKDPVKHRSQEAISKLDNLEPATTELTNQKAFVPYISPLLWMPFVSTLESPQKVYTGVGAFFVGTLPRLQLKQGIIYFDAFYYPEIKNLTGEFAIDTPLFAGNLDILFSRNSLFSKNEKLEGKFSIKNLFIAGYSLPIYNREQYKVGRCLSLLTYTGASFTQTSDKAFSITENIPFTKQINFEVGLDYKEGWNLKKDNQLVYNITNVALGTWDFAKNKLFAGYEGEACVSYGNTTLRHEAGLVVRYTDFPIASTIDMSRAHFNGFNENCLFPGKLLATYTCTMPGFLYGMADANLVVQGLASFGKNSADGGTPETGNPLNFQLEKKINASAELSLSLGGTRKLAVGYTCLLDLGKPLSDANCKFYVNCKADWIRF